MDAKARADLVRAIRDETKQERARQARGFAVLDAAGRVQGRVQRWNARNSQRMQAQNQRSREVYGAIGERIDRGVDRVMDENRRRAVAHDRASNMRQAARIREHGYDISPAFQALAFPIDGAAARGKFA